LLVSQNAALYQKGATFKNETPNSFQPDVCPSFETSAAKHREKRWFGALDDALNPLPDSLGQQFLSLSH
jgi:hypothetical protein